MDPQIIVQIENLYPIGNKTATARRNKIGKCRNCGLEREFLSLYQPLYETTVQGGHKGQAT